jgi:hypothetical protein
MQNYNYDFVMALSRAKNRLNFNDKDLESHLVTYFREYYIYILGTIFSKLSLDIYFEPPEWRYDVIERRRCDLFLHAPKPALIESGTGDEPRFQSYEKEAWQKNWIEVKLLKPNALGNEFVKSVIRDIFKLGLLTNLTAEDNFYYLALVWDPSFIMNRSDIKSSDENAEADRKFVEKLLLYDVDKKEEKLEKLNSKDHLEIENPNITLEFRVRCSSSVPPNEVKNEWTKEKRVYDSYAYSLIQLNFKRHNIKKQEIISFFKEIK